jgi:hypothetical protein
MLAALAIETGIDPRELAQLDDYWLATMRDLLEERSKPT